MPEIDTVAPEQLVCWYASRYTLLHHRGQFGSGNTELRLLSFNKLCYITTMREMLWG
jgi:hypothetical protein